MLNERVGLINIMVTEVTTQEARFDGKEIDRQTVAGKTFLAMHWG